MHSVTEHSPTLLISSVCTYTHETELHSSFSTQLLQYCNHTEHFLTLIFVRYLLFSQQLLKPKLTKIRHPKARCNTTVKL